jgi:hypothetical protein
MSLTPTPNFQSVAKSFWDKREGKLGKAVLVGGALLILAVLIFFWGMIVPFLESMIYNTIDLVIGIAILCFLLFLATNKRVHMLVSMMFQMTMRWMVSAIVQTDPIAVIRINITKMREQLQSFQGVITTLAGSKRALEDDIRKKEEDILMQGNKAKQVEKMILSKQGQLSSSTSSSDDQQLQLDIQKLGLDKNNYLTAAGLQMRGVAKEKSMLKSTDYFYFNLSRLGNVIEAQIDQKTQEADQLAQERKTILAAQKAINAATGLLRPDPASLEMNNQALEYLQDETENTLGAMDDLNHWSQKYLTDFDITNAAAAEAAQIKFDELTARLSGAVNVPTTTIVTTGQTLATVNATRNKDGVYEEQDPGNAPYSDFLKK